MTNSTLDWVEFLDTHSLTKSFFGNSDFAELAPNMIDNLQRVTGSQRTILVENTQEELIVFDQSTSNKREISDLVDALPLLYQSYEPTKLEPEELASLKENLEGLDDNLLSGVVFSLELEDNMSFCFVLLYETDDIAEELMNLINKLAEYLEQQISFAINSEQGEELADQQRQQKKRQNTWLESLAWLNDIGNGEYSDEELSKLYESALFQLKIISSSDSATVFSFDEKQSALKTITSYDDDGLTDLVLSLLPDENARETLLLERKDHVFRPSEFSSISDSGFHTLIIYPIVINKKLQLVLCLARKSEAYEEHENMVSVLFGEGVEHLVERMFFLRSMREQNAVLHKEKMEQQALIGKLKEAQEQLLQQEKMASIGQLAAGVAHEINNPVGYVNSNINSMESYISDLYRVLDLYSKIEAKLPQDHALVKKVKAIKDEIDYDFIRDDITDLVAESKEGVVRVKAIVKDLKDFSHVDEAEWQSTNLEKGIDSTLNIVHNELKYKADIQKEYGNIPPVECVASQINQIIMNLLVNAGHAITENGIITIRTGLAENDRAFVEVSDTGKGIAPDNLKKIFDPFFTTKPVGEGTGLGLSLSYSIAEKHDGELSVTSELGVGTTFRLELPLKQEGKVEE